MAFIATPAVYGQGLYPDSLPNNNFIANYKHFSMQQLLDTGNYYYYKNSVDTALIYYGILINNTVENPNAEQQKMIVEALNRSAIIYGRVSDYRYAFKLLIRALALCEACNYRDYESRIYNNLGLIYDNFNRYDIAKSYYSKALSFCEDTATRVVLLINMGRVETKSGQLDSAFYYFNQSLQASRQHNGIHLHEIQTGLASFYRTSKQYDSALHYFHLALDEVKKNHKLDSEAEILSNLSKLFLETNRLDSAVHYIGLSNAIAEKNNFLKTLTENYYSLFKIEELRGRKVNALEYFKTYAGLKDSILDTEVFDDISQLQQLYEASLTNRQIEQLVIEQKIKERTIRYQTIILFIAAGVLLFVGITLLYVFIQKRRLNIVYAQLFRENLELIVSQKNMHERHANKYQSSALTNTLQDELLDKILTIMEDTAVICDPEFSLDKLAELLQSNRTYVSQVINLAMHKNFRSFLNSYRIREAQRLLSTHDIVKYTIESVAFHVGFKSPSTFHTAFKDVTGVSPNFYLKSMQKQHNS